MITLAISADVSLGAYAEFLILFSIIHLFVEIVCIIYKQRKRNFISFWMKRWKHGAVEVTSLRLTDG